MNIFYTNTCPIQAADDHCTVHSRKMIVEYCQLLSTAHHVLDGDQAIDSIYKSTHQNHPSAIWIRKSTHHYNWLVKCLDRLLVNYGNATGKVHASTSKALLLVTHPINLLDNSWSNPPVVAPDEFKAMAVFACPTIAYQQYLIVKFKEWSDREKVIKVLFYGDKPNWY